MKTPKTLTFTGGLLSVALLSGCVGTGPNTQQGAVTGGVLGAIAGGIIGNNSRGHDTLGGAAIGGVLGAIAGGTIGNSIDHQRGTLYGSEREATTNVVVQTPPPQPPPPGPEVVTVQPGPGAVWVSGFYEFDGVRYIWVPGHWAYPPHGYRGYVAARWVYRGGSYVYVRGYWR